MSIFFSRNANYFLAVATSGSFKEAAWNLHLSQPALSIAIKNLEEEVGCTLFLRDKKNAELTTQGRKLFEKLSRLQKIVTDETNSVLQTAYLSKIRIGSIPSFANLDLLPLLKRPELKQTMGRTQFFLRAAGILRNAVKRKRLDFAFINWLENPKGEGIVSLELQDDPAVVCGSKEKFAHITKAKSYDDLADEIWIYPEGRGVDWTDTMPWDKSGFVIADYYSMRFLILGGYGLHEVQLSYFTKEEQKQLAVARFKSRFANNKIYAIWREDISAEAKAVMHSLLPLLKR